MGNIDYTNNNDFYKDFYIEREAENSDSGASIYRDLDDQSHFHESSENPISAKDTHSAEKNRLLEGYFRDIQGYRLLSGREEKKYSALMDNCKKSIVLLNSAYSQSGANSRRREILTGLFRKKLEEKRNVFINSNLRFVISISRQYTGRGMSLADLIQEGNLGLMAATEKFDHKKGFRFTTYSSWWIRQSISRAVMKKTNTVSVPVYLQENRRKVLRSKYKLTEQQSSPPSVEEISRDSDVSLYAVKQIIKGINVVSLDNPVSDNNENTYKDMLVSVEPAPLQEIICRRKSLYSLLSESLNILEEKEESIIRLRYGFGIDTVLTLKEIAGKYSLSPERVRQIERNALKKISASSILRKIADHT